MTWESGFHVVSSVRGRYMPKSKGESRSRTPPKGGGFGLTTSLRKKASGPKGGPELQVRPTRSQGPKRAAARALALAASSARFLGGAVVSRARRRRVEIAATSSMAELKAGSLALEG